MSDLHIRIGTMKTVKPTDIHPALSEERIHKVARVLQEARETALAVFEPGRGDTPWSLGCVSYSRSCFLLARAAEGEYSDWLSIVEDAGLHFVFAIGGVPLRFYKGEPEHPKSNSLRRNLPEVRAQQQAFQFMEHSDSADKVLRLALETNEAGAVETVSLVELDDLGRPLNSFSLHLDKAPLLTFTPKHRQAVSLPPPVVRPKGKKANVSKEAGK